MLSSRRVDLGVFLRGLAITLVVFNHAHPDSSFPLGWGGGMIFLMLLSGQNFARFALAPARDGSDVRRAALSLARDVFIPSFAIVVLWQLLRRELSVSELLFVRNWVDHERLAKFPVWYVQVLLQFMVLFAALFSIPPFARSFLRSPGAWSLGTWATFLAVRYLTRPPAEAGGEALEYWAHLPTSWLFDFSLGWILFFFARPEVRTAPRAALVSCAVVLSAALGTQADTLHFYTLAVGGTLLTWIDEVKLPKLVLAPVELCSQAIFTLFLTHRMFFVVCEKAPLPYVAHPDVKFAIAMLGGLATWLTLTAARRAYRRL